MGKVFRLTGEWNLLLSCFGLSALYCTSAYTAKGEPARQPGIPQPRYWHGTVRLGDVIMHIFVIFAKLNVYARVPWVLTTTRLLLREEYEMLLE